LLLNNKKTRQQVIPNRRPQSIRIEKDVKKKLNSGEEEIRVLAGERQVDLAAGVLAHTPTTISG
jgi:hypothetical protein